VPYTPIRVSQGRRIKRDVPTNGAVRPDKKGYSLGAGRCSRRDRPRHWLRTGCGSAGSVESLAQAIVHGGDWRRAGPSRKGVLVVAPASPRRPMGTRQRQLHRRCRRGTRAAPPTELADRVQPAALRLNPADAGFEGRLIRASTTCVTDDDRQSPAPPLRMDRRSQRVAPALSRMQEQEGSDRAGRTLPGSSFVVIRAAARRSDCLNTRSVRRKPRVEPPRRAPEATSAPTLGRPWPSQDLIEALNHRGATASHSVGITPSCCMKLS
jgi:hypothetical protein